MRAHELAGDDEALTVLRRLIGSLPFAALIADSHGRFVAANSQATVLTGYSVSELERLSVWHITPTANNHEAETLWRAFLSRGDQHGEYPVLTKTNRVVLAEYAARTDVLPGLHVSLLRPLAPQ